MLEKEKRKIVLAVKNLTFGYDDALKIFDGTSFNIYAGEVVGIIGGNGSGKSTLLKLILGFEMYEKGQIDLFLRKGEIGYLPQTEDVDIDFPILVEQVISSGLRRHDQAKVDDILKEMNLEKFRKSKLSEISGGQRQRALLGRALISNSKLILLDEPLASLDLHSQIELVDIIRKLKDKGIAILIVEHNHGLLAKFSDRILCVNHEEGSHLHEHNSIIENIENI